ncbi:MAG: glycosyltransferase [Bacteroidia bacterium]|nr:glycosyltransferase [Bacteroidia bacterium]
MAETVSTLNCEIIIIGRKSGHSCDHHKIPFSTRRFSMIFNRGFLFYKFFNIRLFFYLLFHKYDLLISNDLDTLIPNFLVSKLKHLPLVYDSHEYFTGVPEIQNRPFVKWIWKSIERMIFPRLKHVMTVSDSIAAQYESEYGVRPVTVRNCSRSATGIISYSRDELGILKDHLLLILQGGGINIDRGGIELIEAVSQTENVSLLIVGSGDLFDILKRRVSELNLTGRVKFVPKVPWEILMRYTRSADVGLSFDKNTNLNYRFSLPNKLFDYISAGIPVIASDLPEVRKIVLEKGCGMIIPDVTPEEISKALKELRDNKNLLSGLKKNAVIASESVNWEIESEIVKGFYNKILICR